MALTKSTTRAGARIVVPKQTEVALSPAELQQQALAAFSAAPQGSKFDAFFAVADRAPVVAAPVTLESIGAMPRFKQVSVERGAGGGGLPGPVVTPPAQEPPSPVSPDAGREPGIPRPPVFREPAPVTPRPQPTLSKFQLALAKVLRGESLVSNDLTGLTSNEVSELLSKGARLPLGEPSSTVEGTWRGGTTGGTWNPISTRDMGVRNFINTFGRQPTEPELDEFMRTGKLSATSVPRDERTGAPIGWTPVTVEKSRYEHLRELALKGTLSLEEMRAAGVTQAQQDELLRLNREAIQRIGSTPGAVPSGGFTPPPAQPFTGPQGQPLAPQSGVVPHPAPPPPVGPPVPPVTEPTPPVVQLPAAPPPTVPPVVSEPAPIPKEEPATAPPTERWDPQIEVTLRNEGFTEEEINNARGAFNLFGADRYLQYVTGVRTRKALERKAAEAAPKVSGEKTPEELAKAARQTRFEKLTAMLLRDPDLDIGINRIFDEDPELAKMLNTWIGSNPDYLARLRDVGAMGGGTPPPPPPSGIQVLRQQLTEAGLNPAQIDEAIGVFEREGWDAFLRTVERLQAGEGDAGSQKVRQSLLDAGLTPEQTDQALGVLETGGWDLFLQEVERLQQVGVGGAGEPEPTEPKPVVPEPVVPEEGVGGVEEKAAEPPVGGEEEGPVAPEDLPPEEKEKFDIAYEIFKSASEGGKFDAFFRALDVLNNEPLRSGAESFLQLTPEQKSELTKQVEATLSTFIAQLGFDPAVERRTRTDLIERGAQTARENLARQFGIDPGGPKSGPAQRQFELLEANRLNQLDSLESEISQRVLKAKQDNLKLLTDALGQVRGLDLKGGELTLEGAKLIEVAREFDTTLTQRIQEFSKTFGLDEAKTGAIVAQIQQDIANSTRKLSADIGQGWAEIFGVAGTPTPITAADLGVDLSGIAGASYLIPGGVLVTPEASALRASFEAMMGRRPTSQELNALLTGGSAEVEGAPTLESRRLASIVAEQTMERLSKYSAIAASNRLDRDKFDRAKTEADRTWSLTTLDVASIVGIDSTVYRLARHQYDRRLRAIEAERPATLADRQEAAEAAARDGGIPLASFLRANDLFDSAYGLKLEAIATQNGMDAQNFARANRQADAQEDKMEVAWNALLKTRKPVEVKDYELFNRSPTLFYATQGLFAKETPSPFRGRVPQEVVDAPESYVDYLLGKPENRAAVDAIKSAASAAFGEMDDSQVREYLINIVRLGSVTEASRVNITYLDPNWMGALDQSQLMVLMNLIGAGFTPEREKSGGSAWETFLLSAGQIITAMVGNPYGPVGRRGPEAAAGSPTNPANPTDFGPEGP